MSKDLQSTGLGSARGRFYSHESAQRRIQAAGLLQWFRARPSGEPDAIVPDHRHADCRRAGNVGTAARDEQRMFGAHLERGEDGAVSFRAWLIKLHLLRSNDGIEWNTAARGSAQPQLGRAIGHNTET